jgi:transcriptional regulator with XRE-family HTH domain
MATHGNDFVREARKRAGLTQRELAEKAGTTQSAIARLESGRTRPAFDDVLRLVRLCGFDLDVMLVERDDSDWAQARSYLAIEPAERFERAARFARRIQRLQGEVARGA